MKRLLVGLMLLGSAVSGQVAADEHEISGNIALTSDYRFRGISQTERDPAVQGGFDYAHESGLYAGVWASNVSFAGGTEFDFYGGWGGDVAENVSVDVGYLYYAYPSDGGVPRADYSEIYGSLGFFGATVGLNYSPEYTYGTGKYFYFYGAYSFPLGEVASLDLNLGLNQFKNDNLSSFLGTVDAGKSYLDYSIGVTAAFAGVDWTIAYVGTDIDKDDCFPSSPGFPDTGTKLCQGNAVVTVSKSL